MSASVDYTLKCTRAGMNHNVSQVNEWLRKVGEAVNAHGSTAIIESIEIKMTYRPLDADEKTE